MDEESPTVEQLQELLRQVQEAERKRDLLNDAEGLFRQADRLLSREATDQSKEFLEEILQALEHDRVSSVSDAICERVARLRDESDRWKTQVAVAKPPEAESPRGDRERDSALSLRPLHQDERVYAEIFPSDGANFEAVLHAPDRVLPVEKCFTLVAWPAGRPYNPDVATVLGQAAKSEPKAEGVPSAESVEAPEGIRPPQPPSGATSLKVAVPQLSLSPGHYWLALAYNDVPLPGPRAVLQVDPRPPNGARAETTTQEAPKPRRDWWGFLQNLGLVLLLVINTGAFVAMASSLWSLTNYLHSSPTATPMPSLVVVTATPTPRPTDTPTATVPPTDTPTATVPPTKSPETSITATPFPLLSKIISATLAVTQPGAGQVLTLVGQPITITILSLTTTAQLPSGNLLLMDGITTVKSLTDTFQLSAKPQLFPVTFYTPTQYTQLAVAWQPTVTRNGQPSEVVQLPSLTIVSNEAIVTASGGVIRSGWSEVADTIIATVPISSSVRLIGVGHYEKDIWLRVAVPNDLLGIAVKEGIKGNLIEGWVYANHLKYDPRALALLPKLPENVTSTSQ